MKKTIFMLATATALIAGTMTTACQSQVEKNDAAQKSMQEPQGAQKGVTAEEWQTFKSQSETKIQENETRIAELKAKLQKSGEAMDEQLDNKIDVLEQKNKDLKAKIENFELTKGDWESFKSEFNHDIDALGQSLKDFTVDNK
jgi:hypothetical protein